MELLYKSTRGGQSGITASGAILQGLARDGGLFVPEKIPQLNLSLKELSKMSYQETAYEVMKLFLTDFTEEELRFCIDRAYDSKFDTEVIAPLVKVNNVYYLELFHGATIAFKDMALSILPYLMTTAAKKNRIKNEIVILTATSGDTGKAALAGFADVPGTRIIVFYPKDGVSPVQEKQMVTQKGDNTLVVGIRGNFDDAQSGVKAIFGDKDLERQLDQAGYQFSSANSINIGRLVPQIVYYVYAYAKLLENGELSEGEKMNVVVPTGNFGNILAAYYAREMGLPIDQLICASNSNNVLTDFLREGVYDRNRTFYNTMSPSMDILISSNLERLLLSLTQDPAEVKEYMTRLAQTGRYQVSDRVKSKLQKRFKGYFCDDQETQRVIRAMFERHGYLIDTHTAVAFSALEQYRRETGDNTPAIVASTASPFKFCGSVLEALGETRVAGGLDALDQLTAKTGQPAPAPLAGLRDKSVRFTQVVEKDRMVDAVLSLLG